MQHQLIHSNGATLTMTSREIAELVESRHDNVKRTIETLAEKGVIPSPQSEEKATAGRPVVQYLLDKRSSLIVVAQLCPEFTARIVDRWQQLEAERAQPQQLTTAAMFLQSAQLMVQLENRTAALESAQAALEQRVEAAGTVLQACPSNAEPITHIRRRMSVRYGLSEATVSDAMRQMPYSPRPAGMVRNTHDAAQGSSYAVYWVQDVNKFFERFVRECKRETGTLASHPFMPRRFAMSSMYGDK